jgi:Lamin Tail Domain
MIYVVEWRMNGSSSWIVDQGRLVTTTQNTYKITSTSSVHAMKVATIITVFIVAFSAIASAQTTDVIISEMMINPTVGKENGTWFEFYNPGNQTFDLSNRYLRLISYHASSNANDQVAFKIPSGLSIPPKQYFVIVNNDNRTTNGNVPVDWKYEPHFEMNETLGAFFPHYSQQFGNRRGWGDLDPQQACSLSDGRFLELSG